MTIQRVIDTYVSDRNYLAIYAYRFLKPPVHSIFSLFSGGWLYSLGLEIHWIILFYAFNFTFMGLVAPLGVKFLNLLGVLKTEIISSLFLLFSILCLALVEQSMWFIVPAVLFRGAASIANSLHDVIEAVYFEDHNRGRGFTMANVMSSIALIITISLSGWLISIFSFYGVAALSAVLLVLSNIPLMFLEERMRGTANTPLHKLYRQPLEKEFRPYLFAFMGEQFAIICRVVFIPLILYLATQDFQIMALIVALAVLVESALLLGFGHWIDRTAGKYPMPLRWATLLNATILIFYGFFAKTPLTLFLADTSHKLSDKLFMSGFRTRMHYYIRHTKSSLLIFGAGWQMSLCFWEFIFLSLFALIAFMFGEQSIGYIMMICAAGTFFAYGQARKLKIQDHEHNR